MLDIDKRAVKIGKGDLTVIKDSHADTKSK